MSEWRSDMELVQRVVARDRAGLEEFACRMQCVPLIVASLNARRGRPLHANDVNDLAQDVFVHLWKKLPTFGGHSSLESWAFRFCHYEFLNAVRRKHRATSMVELGAGAPEPAESPSMAGPFEYGRLHAILERLPSREAAVIRAKHFDGLTFEEIGVRLGTPSNTAKTNYYRGIERLRILLRSTQEELL
jgi:RNA polymerase sigma-70 factor, ECF subfamily